jgi:PAS domain S-box-containing protein
MASEVDLSSERERADKVQSALYRIAELASAAQDMQEFYRALHAVVGELMYANNFYIALYDEDRKLMSYPYFVDEVDADVPEPNKWEAFGEGDAKGTTAYVLRTGEPQLLDYARLMKLVDQREVELLGVTVEDSSWLGVPLKADSRTIGVLVVQSYSKDVQYTEQDKELLAFVGQHVGAALSRARAIEETRQRNAELALINSVQEALAGELELQAIYDVVGDKIRDVFDAQVVDIGIYDEGSGLIHFPYSIERGVRYPDEPMPLSELGFRRYVMETREPLLVDEDLAAASERYGNPVIGSGEMPKSVLYVPLVAGGKARGAISLQNFDREHAFGESDQQLLATLARSLSVALENARLVHETRQRNAELALINSVQDALAGELELQAIYDVVGDKIQEIFDAQVVDIGIYDFDAGLTRYPYAIERGVRFPDQPTPMMRSPTTQLLFKTKAPVLINDVPAWDLERGEQSPVPQGEYPLSVLVAPMISGEELRGRISLQNLDRTSAFSENDVRLLTTLAGSLSVALENARLMHETRQRNAELALINSVQAAIAGELDPQAIYDLVGDKLQEVFDAQVVSIAVHDETTGMLELPYVIERGVRLEVEAMRVIGFRKHVMDTGEPLLINERWAEESERYGNPLVLAGEMPQSALFVPLIVGGRPTGVISLQNVDREHAFTESDQRLLTTLGGSLSVALDNARLVHETRQRVAELATVNSVGQALATQLELDALIELVGERVRETFAADIAYVALHDERAGQIDFVYYYETGERRTERPLKYGEGLTSQILDSGEPLLLNREEHYEGRASVGTPSRSYLGVPIMVSEKAIGVISVQSTREEGRFDEGDMRLLATIAANVGVAIQTARLFAEIARQKQYFESLVEISPAAVVVMDADEQVTGWNPAAAELFGYSAEEATGRAIDDLVLTEEFWREGRDVTSQALEKGRAHRITRRARKDGALVDVEMMLVPLMVDGEHVGFYAIYHDITELQRARQEAEAATQAKSAFLATMSHEIRTPMNAVIGMTDLLLGTELTDEQREFAEVVHSSGDALLHVIDDILDYSKIEAGKLELEREPFDLRECVEGALDIVAPRAWEKEIELGCLIDEDAPAGIVGDEARLRQVLLNLLSNAVKFTEKGEIVVLVDAEPSRRRSYRLELAVRDTGIGIAPDRMDKLFASFSQVDASTTRRYGGTGLGLAISKRLVEMMGGTISVESEVGKGSAFHISLTVKAADVPRRISLDEALPHLAGKRILVVDDNATNREIVTRHARSWGMEPVAVELPTEALALVAAGEHFDVAVLDMMMPDLDGIALAREIRKHRTERELPLLLLTSLGRLPQARSADEFSAQLSKPLKASQLYNALLRLLTADEAGDAAVDVATDGKAATSALRILLAEDNVMNQKVALRLLQRLGYGADIASNGIEALEALDRQPYDVVLMDVQMPELDGLEASRRICERWPAEARPRIIAMTANAMPEDREACFAAGMDDYVAKPIRAAELVEALRRVKPLPRNDDVGANGGDLGFDAAAALENLRELVGDDFVDEVIDAFFADAPTLLATLRRSLDEQDADELRRAAHTLKSNGSTLGAQGFSELCRELEQRAKNGQLAGASELVDRIEQAYQPLQQTLAALRSTAAS